MSNYPANYVPYYWTHDNECAKAPHAIQRDVHGCLTSAGYMYNASTKSCCRTDCVQPKSQDVPSSTKPTVDRPGGGVDKNGCDSNNQWVYQASNKKCCKVDCHPATQ